MPRPSRFLVEVRANRVSLSCAYERRGETGGRGRPFPMSPAERAALMRRSVRVIETNERYVNNTLAMCEELARLAVPWHYFEWRRLKAKIEARNERTRQVNAEVARRNHLVRMDMLG